MKLYLAAARTWCGTQADAKAIDKTFVPIDVPVDKEGLMGFLNKMQDKIHGLIEERNALRDGAGEAPVVYGEGLESTETPEVFAVKPPAPVQPPAVAPTSYVPQYVVDQILASEGKEFASILEATLTRLGEVRGTGWNDLTKLVSSDAKSRTSIERGLGYLVLETARSASPAGDAA